MRRKKLGLLLLAAGYLLGIHRGYVALWKDEDPEPIYVTRMPADLLPDADRRALEKGIVLPDGVSLSGLLEDYCS